MKDLVLEDMELGELTQLRKDIDKAITSFEDRRQKEARAVLEAKAREMGYTLAELTGGKSKAPAHPPKYRHPENPALTWSGRGRRPEWIKEGLEAGKPLDSFLI